MKDVVAGAFRELGLNRWAAKGMSKLLRGEVTDTVCRLLPGVTDSGPSAARWLTFSAFALPPTLGPTAATMVPGVDENRANAATLPTLLMLGIGQGLMDRARPGSPTLDAPNPPAALHQARAEAETYVTAQLAAYIEDWRAEAIRSRLGQFLRESMGDTEGVEWGGWAMLAAMEAMRMHRDVLPEPGRREQSPGARMAGRSFQVGRALAYGVALDLIAYGER